jgi:N-acetylmuramoyl-L-alanine amidase
MFRGLKAVRVALWASIAVFALAHAGVAKPVVTGVRTGEHVSMTRFVLDLSEPVTYRVFMLSDPYRVVIDLPEIEWRASSVDGYAAGLIRGLRYGHFSADVSRVVLDVAGPVTVARAFLLEPQGKSSYRFVLDLAPVDEATFRQNARVAALPRAPVAPAPRAAKPGRRADGKRVVVIDPGHGGIDPGTVSARGTYEKAVTLAIARELAGELNGRGRYHVVLTRERDVFVRLRKRLEKARKAGGELFISLHADSIENRRFRGTSVYTLSEKSSDAESELLAAKENKADIIAGVDLAAQSDEVTSILINLAQRETMNLSASFANMLLPEIGRTGRLLRKSHRFAGFAVLKAPDVPSVLIEMGYLSNREDERLLTSRSLRRNLILAIARAIDRYFAARAG